MSNPIVTVLLSVYNGHRFLKEQLESIFSQERVNINLIVRDDGSPDKSSLSILKEFQSLYPKQVTIIEGENKGFAESFSDLIDYAYKESNSEFYAFADQDDVWMNDKLFTGINSLQNFDCDTPNCYFSNTLLVDSTLNEIGLGRISIPIITKKRSLVQNFATGCTMVFNRTAIELYSEHRPEKMYVHDYWMFLISTFLGTTIYDSVPHIKYRQHANNQIGAKKLLGRFKRRFQRFARKDKHFFEIHNSLFLNTFNEELSEEDKCLIRKVSEYKTKRFGRLRLLFSSINYDNSEFNFFMRLKIILGWL